MLSTTAPAQLASRYVIAGYYRISQEDDANNESNSIKNQRDMIRYYITEREDLKGAVIVDYVDDGISGSHTAREGYQRLLSDVKRGDVDCIIVKDLSRIGRDMLEVDDLLMNHLVMLNVRFIAINNGYDSLLQPRSNLELSLINLTNQYYSRDLAIKSKTAKLVKQKRGEYLALAPFGYEKSKTVRNKLVPDDEAAEYVRLIYSLAAEGHRTTQIAQILNAQGIPSPSVYKTRKGCKNIWTQVIDTDYCFWTNGVVRKLIMNEVYIGKAVSNKFRVKQTGTGHTEPRPADEWIIVPDAHEPLVSESVFRQAQLVLPKQKYFDKTEHIFGNKVKCPSCGHAMVRYTRQNPRFKCGTAKFTDHYGCKDYNILQSVIEKSVLASIRTYAAVLLEREQMKLEVKERERLAAEELEARIRTENDALQVLDASKVNLYLSLSDKKITMEVYQHKRDIINNAIESKREAIARMETQLEEFWERRSASEKAAAELDPLAAIDKLDAELVNLLIEKILIHAENDIEIVWKDRY